MRGKAHSDETKAAVMAALLTGQGASEIARQYELNEATVRNWKRSLPKTTLTSSNDKKEIDFGELLSAYLKETLVTLTVQAQHFRDKDWLQKQPAADLAVLHGVQTDKAIRLLAALEQGNETRTD